MSIYIRPLKESDALISYCWRNDPDVWKHTGNRPNKFITPEIETQWIRKVLTRADQIRFAICLEDTDEYIGNVQFTEINSVEAEFHIFIGEKKFWGKGFGTDATALAVNYAFEVLELQRVYLIVKPENVAAIRAYQKVGFRQTSQNEDGSLRLVKQSAVKSA